MPFALWNKTAFLAERVLGNVITSGIKLMVLAVIIGIGSTLFSAVTGAFKGAGNVTLAGVMGTVLASTVFLWTGMFGPGIASALSAARPSLAPGLRAGPAARAPPLTLDAWAPAPPPARECWAGPPGAPSAGTGAAWQAGSQAAFEATGGKGAGPGKGSSTDDRPAWARRLTAGQRLGRAATLTAHNLREGERAMPGAAPDLKQKED